MLVLAGDPVVICVDAPALLGQASPEDSTVASGLLGLARALAFEGGAKGWRINVVAVDAGEDPDPQLVESGRVHSWTHRSGAQREQRGRRQGRAMTTAGCAVVTGAAGGLGVPIARALGEAGYELLLVDMAEGAHDVARDLTAGGMAARAVVADLSTDDGLASVVAAVGSSAADLRLLVNNAGITRDARLGQPHGRRVRPGRLRQPRVGDAPRRTRSTSTSSTGRRSST